MHSILDGYIENGDHVFFILDIIIVHYFSAKVKVDQQINNHSECIVVIIR